VRAGGYQAKPFFAPTIDAFMLFPARPGRSSRNHRENAVVPDDR
jgi:hypothetical protein